MTENMEPQSVNDRYHFVDGFEAPFSPIKHINTEAATPSTVFLDNVLINIRKPITRLQFLPGFQKIKGKNKPIAIVGGGPSVKTQIDKIKEFKTIIVAGSANDWLMEQGIIPTYATVCDPDPVSINYFNKLDTETIYLIATSCDPKLVDHFKDHQRALWHCHSEEASVKIREVEPEYYGVAGGCTVGLRSICIAMLLGYCDIHLFGFDSCLNDKEHHAYGFSTEAEEDYGVTHRIMLGKEKPGDKVYTCIGYQLAQAQHFKEFYFAHYNLFTPTFYGEGMLQDLAKLLKETVDSFIAQDTSNQPKEAVQ